MRTQNILVIMAILYTAILSAQVTISGKIKDKNGAIPFANVILTTVEGKIVTGTTSNDEGDFSLTSNQGDYRLLISFIGYENLEKELSIKESQNLGVLEIKEEENVLNEVVINSEKKLIEQKNDRLVFNVANSVSVSGGDAVDVLKVAPGVSVQNNAISMVGGEATRVMIDGRMMQLSGEDLINFLNSIAAEDIKSVEIITNPPAQYDAVGNGGIINIVYKKGRKNSWKNTTSLTYNANKYGFLTLRNNFSFSKNKLQLNASVSTIRGALPNAEKSFAYFPTTTWKVDIETKEKRKNNAARLSLNYELSKNVAIGGQYLGNFNTPSADAPGRTEFYNLANQLDSVLVKTEPRKTRVFSHVLNSYVLLKLDTLGRKLSLDFDYFDYENTLDADALVNAFSPQNELLNINQSVRNYSNQQIKNYNVKLDMHHPFKKIDVSYGAKFSFVTTKNRLENFNTITGAPILDTNLSNEFEYEENVQAFYISASKKINEKWSFQGGLRLENTETRGVSKTLNQINENSYVKLFPSLYVSYKKNESNTFSFNYGRGINRPVFRDLNPFRNYLNSNVYSEGNPFIQPSFVDRFNLIHNYKGKLITTLYFHSIDNGFGTLFSAEPENNIQAVIRRNYYKGIYWQLSELYNVKPFSWWKSQNYVHISGNSSTVFDEFDVPVKNGIQFNFSTNNTFTVSNDTSLQVDFFYQPKSSANIYTLGTMYGLNVGVKKSFFNKKIQASVLFNDVFNTASLNNLVSEINGVRNVYSQNYNSRHIRFSLSYSFGNKKIKVKDRGFGNNDEQNRAN
ncbi:TonB-dependent receptor [uncultured Tenacibaculum sp.]|uniref:TonB-dependent receptor domain-containing protein n=1 Tax=uncultured Tenacibaculum sp. TaxID=174713 RepID=UPI00261CBC61|nr:TonB-dependent receptor [uncultured Tenacibaculum sp.]